MIKLPKIIRNAFQRVIEKRNVKKKQAPQMINLADIIIPPIAVHRTHAEDKPWTCIQRKINRAKNKLARIARRRNRELC